MRSLQVAIAATVLSTALASCNTFSARKSEYPGAAWVSTGGLDATASCVVQALNRSFSQPLGALTPNTHSINIIDPGRVYEAKPQHAIIVGTDVYFVRVSRVTDSQTNIELFAVSPYFQQIAKTLPSCGKAV